MTWRLVNNRIQFDPAPVVDLITRSRTKGDRGTQHDRDDRFRQQHGVAYRRFWTWRNGGGVTVAALQSVADAYNMSPADIYPDYDDAIADQADRKRASELARERRRRATPKTIGCTSDGCNATIESTERKARDRARWSGWALPAGDAGYLCPDHKPANTGDHPEYRRLLARIAADTRATQKAADDAEYRRRLEARQARDRELADAVHAQHHRPLTAAQQAAMRAHEHRHSDTVQRING